jgi:hypothetical protein
MGDASHEHAPATAPSPAATDRLRAAVARRTGDLRNRAEVDLTIAGGLAEAGEPTAAAEVLVEYQRVLRAYAHDLEAVIGAAAVEREAEWVLARSDRELRPEGAPPTPELAAGEEADPLVPAPARRSAVRRALGGALTTAVIAAAVIVPNVRNAPQTQLASVEHEARAELEVARQRLHALQSSPSAARAVTTEARELHDRIFALPKEALGREVVREQIRQLLDLEREALEQVLPEAPAAGGLLDEILAIRASLALDEGGPIAAAAQGPGTDVPAAPAPKLLPPPAQPSPELPGIRAADDAAIVPDEAPGGQGPGR